MRNFIIFTKLAGQTVPAAGTTDTNIINFWNLSREQQKQAVAKAAMFFQHTTARYVMLDVTFN